MTTRDRRRPTGLLIVVAVVAFAADQLTKWWALEALADGDVGLVFDWRLHLVRNPAAAFSLGGGLGPVIGVLALAVVVALVVMSREYVGRFPTICVGAVVGGALGNIADRLFRSSDGFLGGEVIDFVDLRFWPVFNVADSCVVLGVLGLAVHALLSPPASPDGADDGHPGPIERPDPAEASVDGDDGQR